MTRPTWPAKDPREKLVATFAYGDDLDAGEAVASAVVNCTVLAGTDANPAAVLDGACVVSGSDVLQPFKGGLDGVTYRLDCLATVTPTGRVLACAATLPVRTA